VRLSPWMMGGVSGTGGSARSRCGFTLIELLVVLVIITILIGFLLPAFARARLNAQRTRADSECAALKNAIKAFHLEYGQWPYTGDAEDGEIFTATDDNWNIIKELGARSGKNYKGILFLEVESFRKDGNAIVDPWGVPYVVEIDTGYPPSKKPIFAGVEIAHSKGE